MARILLVEDSPTQAAEMTMLLEANCHEIIHASNGREGLDILRADCPDLAVTDLEMPEMNGLELVEAMRSDFSHVPTILVTSHGSEELAAEALQRGAAGYVPKSRMSELLNDTITDVLGVIRTDASFSRLISTLQKNVFEFELPNDPMLVTPLVGLLMQVTSGMELLPSVEMVRIGVAVEHAIVNAICHGNLDLPRQACPGHHQMARHGELSDSMRARMNQAPYRDRTVRVEAIATKQEVRVIVADRGGGFDISMVPAKDCVDPRSLTPDDDEHRGRGLVLMSSFVDELVFNETGNEVVLVKKCPGF